MERSPLSLLNRSMSFRLQYALFWIGLAAISAMIISPANAQAPFDGSEAQAALNSTLAGVPPRKPKRPRSTTLSTVKVGANYQSVVHRNSNGVSIAFPDICKTPSPAGPIPIPYPNISRANDTRKGAQKVKLNDCMPKLKMKSYIKRAPSMQPPTQPSKIIGPQIAQTEFSFPAPQTQTQTPAQNTNSNPQTINLGFAQPYSPPQPTQTNSQMTEVAPPPLTPTAQ